MAFECVSFDGLDIKRKKLRMLGKEPQFYFVACFQQSPDFWWGPNSPVSDFESILEATTPFDFDTSDCRIDLNDCDKRYYVFWHPEKNDMVIASVEWTPTNPGEQRVEIYPQFSPSMYRYLLDADTWTDRGHRRMVTVHPMLRISAEYLSKAIIELLRYRVDRDESVQDDSKNKELLKKLEEISLEDILWDSDEFWDRINRRIELADECLLAILLDSGCTKQRFINSPKYRTV